MKKRSLSMLLTLCMVLSLLPAAVYADGGSEYVVSDAAEPVCVCETACTEDSMDPDCPVCGAEDALPEDCALYVPQSHDESGLPEEDISTYAVHYAHCFCGGNVTAGDHTSHSDVDYTAWNGTDSISYNSDNTAYVYLTKSATISKNLEVDGKTLYLCLNGKTLSSNNTAKIVVRNGGHLILCDCQGGGTFKGATKNVWGGACVYLYKSTFDMYGGKLTGGKVTNKNGGGGAIAFDDYECKFSMYGGEISGNNGYKRGGVIFRVHRTGTNTAGGTFNMYGGVIKNNTAEEGGAFYSLVGGTINLEGGTISGNKATASSGDKGGGAIYMRGSGTINISGTAEISGNSSARDGGAIFKGCGAINISGSAKIANNTASRYGGAICLRTDSNQVSEIMMTGGEISGNRADSEGGAVHVFDSNCRFFLYDGKITGNSSVDGGAIYLNREPSTLYMMGGEISGNTATGNGGGVYIYRSGSVCDLSLGTISNNTAGGSGGGIYINPNNNGQLLLWNKPTVKDNKASGKDNNVYLPSGKTLTIQGNGMTTGASVGITTESTSYPVVFSNAYDKDYAKCFFADDAAAHVEYNSDKQLQLAGGAPARSYSLFFDAAGGEGGIAEMYRNDNTFIIPKATPTKDGWHFAGWSRNSGTDEVDFLPEDVVVITEGTSMTLYAVWRRHIDSDSDGFCDGGGECIHEKDSDRYCTVDGCTHNADGHDCCPLRDSRTVLLRTMNADNTSVSKFYDGTTDFTGLKVPYSGGGFTYKFEDGEGCTITTVFDSPEAGDNKTVTVTVTLTGENAELFKFENGTTVDTFTIGGTINKAVPELTLSMSKTEFLVGDLLYDTLSVTGVMENAGITYRMAAHPTLIYPDNDSNNPEIFGASKAEDAGEFWAYAITEETDNYQAGRSNAVKFTVLNFCRVTFEGGSLPLGSKSRNVPWGRAYGELPAPTNDGYEFDGWYTAESGGDEVKAEDIVPSESEQTLYAHWTPIEYSVTVTVSGPDGCGTAAPSSISGVYVNDIIVLTATPAPGFQFVNWTIDGSRPPEYNAYAQTLTFRMPACDLTVEAVFFAKFYDIDWIISESERGSTHLVLWNSKVLDELPKNPTNGELMFTGWKCGDISISADTTYGDLAGSDTVSSITVEAQWHRHDFTAQTVGEEYLKTPATCTEKAVYYISCSSCGMSSEGTAYEAAFEYGNILGHDWGSWLSNGDGTHKRICSRDASHTDTGDCSYDGWTIGRYGHWHTCTACGYETEPLNHSDNDSDHLCDVCGKQITDHSFTAQTAGDEYLKTPATCTEKAVYYKSCSVCGLSSKGTADEATFEYGNILGHDWGEWVSNGNDTHTRICSRNAEHKETDDCSGGTASCTKKAVCTVCGSEYGQLKAHSFTAQTAGEEYLKTPATCTEKAVYYKSCSVCGLSSKGTADETTFEYGNILGHDWGEWVSNGNDTHTRVCSRDAQHKETDNCSGGTAFCTAKAICEYCGSEYGQPDKENHSGSEEWIIDGATHEKKYNCCGAVTVAKAAHSFGDWTVIMEPTETKAGKEVRFCEVCGHKDTQKIAATGGGSSASDRTLSFETNGGSSIPAVREPYGTLIDLNDYLTERSGYSFTGWYSDRALTHRISSIELTGSTTVYAGWKLSSLPFTDVKDSDWFYEDVLYVYEKGLMNGTAADTFSPYLTTTRGMIVSILYRLEGTPAVSGVCPFADVRPGSYYEAAITWAAANGIVTGYSSDSFGPDDNITREQLAAILYRYAKYKGADVSVGEDTNILSYEDAVSISEYAIPAMQWACGAGIVQGTNGTLAPGGDATRAQAAAALHRLCENVLK